MASKQPQQQRGNSYILRSLLLLIAVVVIIGGLFFAIPYFNAHPLGQSNNPGTTPGSSPTINTTATALPANGIGKITAPDGESIGISDGTVAFATDGPGGSDKSQAADKLKAGDTVAAQSLWQSALAKDSGDAESLIYSDDQVLLDANAPYVTIVVATMLTGENASVGRDDLQGAYVAQRELNNSSQIALSVRLLVANSGNDKLYADTVAQQIVLLAKADPTFVGVMGWPFSSRTEAAISTLAKAHIPMVSQTASDDSLTGVSPYFFRAAPANKDRPFSVPNMPSNPCMQKLPLLSSIPPIPIARALNNTSLNNSPRMATKSLPPNNIPSGRRDTRRSRSCYKTP